MMRLTWLAALLAVGLIGRAEAQSAIRITNCGDAKPPSGASNVYMDANGNLCTNTSGGVAPLPGARTIVTLDIKTVTTGGTAVTAIAAGNRTAGGWLQNPSGAVPLCINEISTAVGTTSSGDTTCISGGQSYVITPAAGAVSVISSDSSHPFSGYGLK